MNIILLEKIKKLGDIGDEVKVKSGYARNFLVPNKKALYATSENKKYFEEKKTEIKSQNDKLKRIEEFESPYMFQWNNTNDKEDNSYNDDIKEKRDRWIESLKKDIYVNEAMNLLRDLSSIKSNEILSQINID